jgi:hypothetical protein
MMQLCTVETPSSADRVTVKGDDQVRGGHFASQHGGAEFVWRDPHLVKEILGTLVPP